MYGTYGRWKQWLQSRRLSTCSRSLRRLRERDTLAAPVAAQIDELESRELLSSITYHGGQLLPNVEAQNIYLGSDWVTNPALTGQSAKLDAFTSTIVQSK